MVTNDRVMNNLQVGKIVGKQVSSAVSSTTIDNVNINDTLKVYSSTNMNTNNVSIAIRDKTLKTSFSNLYSDNSVLYYGPSGSENVVLTANNIFSEVNNAFYPTYNSNLTVSNISVLGQTPTNPNDYGHINFDATGGANIRYNSDLERVEVRYAADQSYFDIVGIKATTNNLATNDFLQYDTSSSSWLNKSNITMGGDITLGTNKLKISNNTGITDANGNEFVTFLTDANPVNYLRINNADTGVSPIVESLGTDTNIGMTLKTKGAGDMLFDATSGDITLTTTDISLNASTKVDIGGYIKSSVYNLPTGSWNSGSSNAITINITTDILLINMDGKSDGTYFANIGAGLNGQHLHIIFNRGTTNTGVTLQFGTNKIFTGGGLASKIRFTQVGQSASLIYLAESLNVWAIKNTGAEIDDENVISLGGTINSEIFNVNSNLSTNSGSPLALGPNANIIYINLDGQTDGNYYFSMNNGVTGDYMNIIFNRGSSTSSTARIDFGANNLLAGSGTVRYVTFNANGQSMSCVYITENLSKWQIINTGASVSN